MIKRKQSHLIITTNVGSSINVQVTILRFPCLFIQFFTCHEQFSTSQSLLSRFTCWLQSWTGLRANNGTKSWTGVNPSRMICWAIHAHFTLQSHSLDAWKKNKKSLRFSVFLGSIYFSFEIVCWRQLRTFQHQNMFLYCPRYRRIIHWTVWYDKRFMRHEWMKKSEGNGKFIFRILLIQWNWIESSLLFPIWNF